MGNVQVSTNGNAEEEVHITKQTTKEFMDQVRLVDNAVTGHARATDSITAACEMFLKQENITNNTTLSEEGMDSLKNLEKNVLMTMHTCIYDSKIAMIESFMNFLYFLFEKSERYINVYKDDLLTLSMSKYLKENKHTDTMLHEIKFKTNENMKSEISFLRDLLNSKREEIANLNSRLTGFMEDNELLLKSNKNLSYQISEMKDHIRQSDIDHTRDPEKETVSMIMKPKERPSSSKVHSALSESYYTTITIHEQENAQIKTSLEAKTQRALEDFKRDTNAEKHLENDAKEQVNKRQKVLIDDNKTHNFTSEEHEVHCKQQYERDQKVTQEKMPQTVTNYELTQQEISHQNVYSDVQKNQNISKNIQQTSSNRQEHPDRLKSQNEYNELSEQPNSTTKKTKSVLVQLCYPITVFHSKPAEQMLMDKVKLQLANKNVDMKDRISAPLFQEKGSPLLIMCDYIPPYNDFNKSPTIPKVLERFREGLSEEMAVVIFYNKNNNDVCEAIRKTDARSDAKLNVFHIEHSPHQDKSPLNITAIDGLVDFIMQFAKVPGRKKHSTS